MSYRFTLWVLVAASLSIGSTAVKANVLDDVKGILIDPIKANAATQNALHAIERSGIHAQRIFDRADNLEANFNSNVAGHLKTVSQIVTEARTGLDDSLTTALDRVDTIKSDFFKDAKDTIKCSVATSATTLKTAIADALSDFGERKPRLSIFGMTIGEVRLDDTDIKSPYTDYQRVQDYYREALRDIQPTDPADRIPHIYGEMGRIAELARCHYKPAHTNFLNIYEDELEYLRLDRPWHGTLKRTFLEG